MTGRDFVLLCLCFVLFAEALSWHTASWPGACLVQEDSRQQFPNQTDQENCATFFAGMLIVAQRGVDVIKRDDNDKAIVAAFTIVLALSTIGLWIATLRLWRSTDKLWEAGERQLALIDRNATAQISQMKNSVDETARLALAMGVAAEAAQIQADVAENTLTRIQRPYIYIFGVERLITSDLIPAPTPYVEYSVANFGRTPAVIEIVNVGFFSGHLPEIPIRVDFDHPLVISPILPPQDHRQKLRELLHEQFIDEDLGIIVDLERQTTHPLPRLTPSESFFFRVMVTYNGPYIRGYETSATWIWSSPERRFIQLNDEQYTYTR
jgi:hypothetical protein